MFTRNSCRRSGQSRRRRCVGNNRNRFVNDQCCPGNPCTQQESQPGKKPVTRTPQHSCEAEAQHEGCCHLQDETEQHSCELKRVGLHKSPVRKVRCVGPAICRTVSSADDNCGSTSPVLPTPTLSPEPLPGG